MEKRRKLDAVVVVRLAAKDMEKLKRIAQEKGLRPSTLIRMWILEKLQNAR